MCCLLFHESLQQVRLMFHYILKVSLMLTVALCDFFCDFIEQIYLANSIKTIDKIVKLKSSINLKTVISMVFCHCDICTMDLKVNCYGLELTPDQRGELEFCLFGVHHCFCDFLFMILSVKHALQMNRVYCMTFSCTYTSRSFDVVFKFMRNEIQTVLTIPDNFYLG
jgi:hypothetical protein